MYATALHSGVGTSEAEGRLVTHGRVNPSRLLPTNSVSTREGVKGLMIKTNTGPSSVTERPPRPPHHVPPSLRDAFVRCLGNRQHHQQPGGVSLRHAGAGCLVVMLRPSEPGGNLRGSKGALKDARRGLLSSAAPAPSWIHFNQPDICHIDIFSLFFF